MIRDFLGAVQFLTLVPVRVQTASPGRSALFFPLVGAILGAIGGVLLESARGLLPFTIAALLVLAFWIAITGALHEDGLADVADAFRAGRTPEKILTILKDSRIGTYGALALFVSVLLRWQALSSLATDFIPALVASQAVPRSAMVALAWLAPPVGQGLGADFSKTLTTPRALLAIAQGLAAAIWCGPRAAYWIVLGCVCILMAARAYFQRRIGGVTGDCLGATGQLVEIYLLLLFTCRNCIS